MTIASIEKICPGKQHAVLTSMLLLVSVLWAISAMAGIASIEVTAPKTAPRVGETVQLTVIATLDDGSTIDVTAGSSGTRYVSNSPRTTTVDTDGLVTVLSTKARSIDWLEFFEVMVVNGSALDLIELRITHEDADGDKVSDAWETEHGLNPNDPSDAGQDSDGDGLTNFAEFRTGTDPQNPDTDGDGAQDGEETRRGADPLNPKSVFEINENCTVSVLNRTVQAAPNGGFVLSNIPADQGFFRVRVTCNFDGTTVGGQSGFFVPVADGVTPFADIALGVIEPIPTSIAITAPTTTLNNIGGTTQLAITGTFPDSSTKDLSQQSTGTTYTSSNPAIASVGLEGLVTAGSTSGTAVISAINEGVLASILITVGLSTDDDGDGLPNDFEIANGLNPNDSTDAGQDPDNDGLTNLQEFQRGTDLNVADTDGDGLNDGDEVTRGTNPTNPDSDLDGLLDGDEIAQGSNPLNSDSDGDGLPDGVEVALVGNPFGANPFVDSDGDGLSNQDEIALFTDPTNPDTDGDGLTDGAEVLAGEDPLVPETIPPTVAITNPLDGAILVEGQALTVAVDATDNAAVTQVDISVDGTLFVTDPTAPYELTFTVPAGVSNLTFSASASDIAGNVGSASDLAVSVIPDPSTTMQGTVVDSELSPVAGAEVVVNLTGLTAEFFDFDTPLTTLPDLSGLTPDVTTLVSAINIRNPDQLFGNDPFGVGMAPDYAARFTGLLRITTAGSYEFILGADEGARSIVNGATVVDMPTGIGEFQEEAGTITLAPGLIPIEVLYYESLGDAELQLSYIPPDAELQVVPPSVLLPDPQPFTATSDVSGAFSIPGIPTNLGDLQVSASFTPMDGPPLFGSAGPIPPVRGGITDVGQITVRELVTGTWDILFQGPASGTCVWEIAQSGTDLSITGPCDFVGTVNLTGTIDPGTGSFTASGPATAFCATLTIAATASPDGNSISDGSFICDGFSGTFTGSRRP